MLWKDYLADFYNPYITSENLFLTNLRENGFFQIDELFGIPGDTEDIDRAWFLNSSEKTISKQMQKLIDYIEDKETAINRIAQVIYSTFYNNWVKIHNAYFKTDYAPLENYRMVEVETPNITRTTESSASANASTETESEANGDTYGFNSPSSIPASKSTSNGNSSSSGTNTSSETASETGTRELTRSGNIGVTTSQQMLESELKLRKYNFYQEVIRDMDKLLSLEIYDY